MYNQSLLVDNMYLDILSEKYIIPGVPKQGKMLELMDKTRMIEMVSMRGINAPFIWNLPIDMCHVTYPCITKCYVSSHGGKSDIVIFYSKEDLNAYDNNPDHIAIKKYIGEVCFNMEIIDYSF